MKYIFALVLAVGLAAGVLLGVTQQTPTAEASYYLMDCGDNDHVRWTGNIGRADVYHGGFPTWWRNETIRGAAIWDVSTVGADFDFIMDSSSSHDWKKQTLNSLSEIGITVLAANASTCRLTSVDTWFNTSTTSPFAATAITIPMTYGRWPATSLGTGLCWRTTLGMTSGPTVNVL